MLVNLSDIFTEEGKAVGMEVPLELTEISFQGEMFQILEKSPVRLRLVNQEPGHVGIEAEAKVVIGMRCDRCLKDVRKEFKLQVSEEAVSPEIADADEADVQSGFLEGYQLNVDSLMSNEILTSWPMKVLCREDCKGLCKVCGKDLNEGSCDCDTFVPDPRMAAIMDIFRENKEL